jgi:hypothetical protein
MAHDGQDARPEEDIFLAVLDDELPPQERERFEQDLAGDPALKERFERYRQTVALIRQLGPSPAPKSLLPSVQRRITRRAVQRSWPTLRFPYEMLVFVIILGSLLYFYFNMLPAPPGPVSVREAPVTLQIELTAPPTPDVVARFHLADPGDSAPGTVTCYGRLERSQVEELLAEIAPLLARRPPLPLPPGNRFGILLTAPRP